jgi:asparagine synthase (glutamine-hydrolysing)
MPGLTLAVTDRSIGRDPHARRQSVVAREGLQVFVDTVAGQPLIHLQEGSITAVLDGVMYGLSTVAATAELSKLIAAFRMTGPEGTVGAIRSWSADVDGEFVIAVVDADRKRAVVVTDVLGRLPLYWRSHQNEVVISRTASHVRGDQPLDRVGGAEQAWLRFPLEDRTLIAGVKRTPPAAALTVTWEAATTVGLSTYYQWDLSTPRPNHIEVSSLAGELAERFTSACITRSAPEGTTALLSLSGGLDSRAVAAGLALQTNPMQAHTYSRPGTEHDVSGAKEISSILGFSWQEFALTPQRAIEFRERVVSLTEGLNHAQMGFILEFFDHLQMTVPSPAWYFTGDGGDRVLPDLLPPERPKNFDELIGIIESRFTVAPAAVVEAAYGLDHGTLTNNLRAHVAAYPEEHLEDRIVHFMVLQMAYKWLFEGENRNRHFFWSVSPFFNRQFFSAALAVPLESKRNYALYHSMLGQVSRPIAEIPFAGRWNLPMSSKRWKILETARGYVPLAVRDSLRKRRYKGQLVTSLPELSILGLAADPTSKLLETDAAKYLLTQALLGESISSSATGPKG